MDKQFVEHCGPCGCGVVVDGNKWEVWDDCRPSETGEPLDAGVSANHEDAKARARYEYHRLIRR
jgi:hypothetical protein